MYWQRVNHVDSRYSYWLNNLLNEEKKGIKEDFFVVTYNYDLQIEYCYAKISKRYNLENCHESLGLEISTFQVDDTINSTYVAGPRVLKANGSALFYCTHRKSILLKNIPVGATNDDLKKTDGLNYIVNLLKCYQASVLSQDSKRPLLSYSWEAQYNEDENEALLKIDRLNGTFQEAENLIDWIFISSC